MLEYLKKVLQNTAVSTVSSFISSYAVRIVLIAGALLAAYIYMLKTEISTLQSKLDKERADSVISAQNIELCNEQIYKQNNMFEQQKKKYEDKLSEYKKRLKQNKKVRYKVIYKTIGEKKSDDCEDIKTMLDGIRTIDTDSLR